MKCIESGSVAVDDTQQATMYFGEFSLVTGMSYVCRWGKNAAKQEAGHHAYDAMLVACGRSPVNDEEFPFMSRDKVPVFDKALAPGNDESYQFTRY